CPSTVTDIDGNIYSTVKIGKQCWMQENLKVTHYPNGNAIPYITGNDDWVALEANNIDDAYCYHENNTNSEYGAFYTYAAAIGDNWKRDNAHGQGICPDGWHLPTDEEWIELVDYLGGPDIAGGKMKEEGTTHWNNRNTGATNESGFTALPGGYRYGSNGLFYNAGQSGYWWSATKGNSYYAWSRSLRYYDADSYRSYYDKSVGFSVRCVMN
ncbi:MAG: hypothetical protein EOL98_12820, partial [Negativicutes bacterium]|nr:hypothetical protein [Negativicutes bacterium]